MSDEMGDYFNQAKEYAEQMQKQAELSRMNSEIISHDIYGLFDSLDEHQLQALAMMFNSLTSYKDPQALLGMYYGLCLSARKYRHDICIACGKSHTQQLGLG